MEDLKARPVLAPPQHRKLPVSVIKHEHAGVIPVYYQDVRNGPGSAVMFIPAEPKHIQFLLQICVFDCPTVAVQTNCCDPYLAAPEDVAADVLRPLPDSDEPLVIFGFSGGCVLAILVACSIVRSGRSVKLLLANPLDIWWPQKYKGGFEEQKLYEALGRLAEADSAVRDLFHARGNLVPYLSEAVQRGNLRVKVIVSEKNERDMERAKSILAVTGGEPIYVPTADHRILSWLCPLLAKEANLYSVTFERLRRECPGTDLQELEVRAKKDEAAMRSFWARYPDLQAIADEL